MALVRTFTPDERSSSRPHPTRVDARWQVIRDRGGDALFQISTYGSDERESEPKVSQTIQINRIVAEELVRRLRETFDL
jgi:hypothetical protein